MRGLESVTDDYTLADYFVSLGPLILLVALFALAVRLGWFDRLRDRALDRQLGKGQGPLFREALEYGRIPPGADIDGWRALLAKPERGLFPRLLLPGAVLVLLLIWPVISDPGGSIDAFILNAVPVLLLVGLGIFLIPTYRRALQRRRRLVDLLNNRDGPNET